MKELLEKLERPSDSHKGENGKVLVIGGSSKYTGAPALAARAALRSGSDLVKILTSEEAKPVVQGFSENFIVQSYGEVFDKNSVDKALELEKWADCTVIGPGLSEFEQKAIKDFQKKSGDLVIDAEAIEALETSSGNIFTPHYGEARVLRENYGSVEAFVSQTENAVLLKGEIDRIYFKEKVFENKSGCAGMTVGGTGDVLSGILASFKARGLSNIEASRLAAHVNGKAGEKAFDEYGNGLLATDVVEKIPEVFR